MPCDSNNPDNTGRVFEGPQILVKHGPEATMIYASVPHPLSFRRDFTSRNGERRLNKAFVNSDVSFSEGMDY